MQGSPPLFYNRGMERMTGFLLPLNVHRPYYQQHQPMMMGTFYFPPSLMVVAPPSYYPVNRLQSMDQSFTNLGIQNYQRRADRADELVSCELARARERITELEACLKRVEEEKKTWQRIASEFIASKTSDASDAASCTGHPLAMEEPNEPKRKKSKTRYSV